MNTKNTFKAVLAATTIMSASLGAMAHGYPGYRVVPCRPAPIHHHHHHYGWGYHGSHHSREILGVGAGILGIGLIANAFSKPEKETVVVPQPVVVQQTPVVVQQTPVVVQQTPVVKQPRPKYVTRQFLEWNGKEYVQRTVTELVYE